MIVCESISICLINKKTNELNGFNELMHVILHELAHVMTQEYKHNSNFWKHFEFLQDFASKHNIYKRINYRTNPVPFWAATELPSACDRDLVRADSL